jgi:hypothetical protein
MLLAGRCDAKEIEVGQLLVPNFAKAQIVSDGMNVNGVDVVIIQFYTKESFQKIEQYYRKVIKDIKISQISEWKIISWISDKKLNTVQVTYNELEDAHHGFIALSNLPSAVKRTPSIGEGFPALRNSHFQNDIKATDLNKKSRTIILTNKSSVKDNINFYKNHYVNKGWNIKQVFYANDSKSASLMMDKRGDEVNLTVNRNAGKSDVVAVVVRK